jgi:hypothetical protein
MAQLAFIGTPPNWLTLASLEPALPTGETILAQARTGHHRFFFVFWPFFIFFEK